MYTLKTVFTNSGPATSTPVLAKVYHSLNLNSGISDDGLTLYDLSLCLLHTTQLKIGFLMNYCPLVSQKMRSHLYAIVHHPVVTVLVSHLCKLNPPCVILSLLT